MDKFSALKQYYGHNSFRPGQEELIEALLSGRDVLGVMPTGAGKSMCYQLPALLLSGMTLVVSPLISLMKDQVAALIQVGIPAAFINSSLNAVQYQEVFQRAKKDQYKILYVAPERLATSDFARFAANAQISLIAVDEAHCISQWGQDFRPSYLKIVDFIDQLPYRPTIGAFTATATPEVKHDIVRLLRLREPLNLTTGCDRPNLYFEVAKPDNKRAYMWEYIARHRDKSGIVYCATRKTVETVCDELLRRGILATRYHAGLEDEERQQNQEDFVYDHSRVMVATNAFGMGIDKSNISFVIHYNMPKNIESYYQEAGRAGRDGEPADCILLFSSGDVQTAKYLIKNSEKNEVLTVEERNAVMSREWERLDKMVNYCKTNSCLREYILNYFGEKYHSQCGHCGNCRSNFVQKNITIEAQKILSGVARVEKKYSYGLGVTLIAGMLHGSGEQRILQLGLDKLPTYGVMREIKRMKIREYIDYLVSEGYLELTKGLYPVLSLTDSAREVLFRGKNVTMPVSIALGNLNTLEKTSIPQRLASTVSDPRHTSLDEELLNILKDLRSKLAQEARVPAYIIFSNSTLSDMAAKMPRSLMDFLEVSGVGEVKAKRYGEQFLNAINAYLNGDLVIMSIETYEREMTLADVYKKIAVAEKQVQDGELLDGQEVLAKLRRKHGR